MIKSIVVQQTLPVRVLLTGHAAHRRDVCASGGGFRKQYCYITLQYILLLTITFSRSEYLIPLRRPTLLYYFVDRHSNLIGHDSHNSRPRSCNLLDSRPW